MIPLYPRKAEGVMSLQNGDDLWSVMLAHHRLFFNGVGDRLSS